jgi:hypothetical protein
VFCKYTGLVQVRESSARCLRSLLALVAARRGASSRSGGGGGSSTTGKAKEYYDGLYKTTRHILAGGLWQGITVR